MLGDYFRLYNTLLSLAQRRSSGFRPIKSWIQIFLSMSPQRKAVLTSIQQTCYPQVLTTVNRARQLIDLTIDIKVSLQSILSFYSKPRIIQWALQRRISLQKPRLSLQTYLLQRTFRSLEWSTILKVLFSSRDCSSSFIAFSQSIYLIDFQVCFSVNGLDSIALRISSYKASRVYSRCFSNRDSRVAIRRAGQLIVYLTYYSWSFSSLMRLQIFYSSNIKRSRRGSSDRSIQRDQIFSRGI